MPLFRRRIAGWPRFRRRRIIIGSLGRCAGMSGNGAERHDER